MARIVGEEIIDLYDGSNMTDHGMWVEKATARSARIIEVAGRDYDFTPLNPAIHNAILASFGKNPDGVTDRDY